MKRGGSVYIIANTHHTVLYIGVTADLARRIWEHKQRINPTSFAAKYNCDKLVYYCHFSRIEEAIAEEKRLKGFRRNKKLDLIFAMNPLWQDLYDSIQDH